VVDAAAGALFIRDADTSGLEFALIHGGTRNETCHLIRPVLMKLHKG
jgi:hypothetical protein